MFYKCGLIVPDDAVQKIKSRGCSIFNNLNEFIIEQILFFGITTNWVKKVESKWTV